MQVVRPVFASDPRSFGRGVRRTLADPSVTSRAPSDDLKLFATTFVAGFVFVSMLLA